jgi:purine-cytosine permease-like protein
MNEFSTLLGYIVLDWKGFPIVDYYCRNRDVAKAIALFRLNLVPKKYAFNGSYARGAWENQRVQQRRKSLGLRVLKVYAQ